MAKSVYELFEYWNGKFGQYSNVNIWINILFIKKEKKRWLFHCALFELFERNTTVGVLRGWCIWISHRMLFYERAV